MSEWQALIFFLSLANAIGIGGILKWVIRVEGRLSRIEGVCSARNDSCHDEE